MHQVMGRLRARLQFSERFLRLSKEGFWIVLGQAMALLGSIIGVRLVTELMNPAAYGEVALGVTVATLVNQMLFGPLVNGVTRFYAPAHEQGELGAYLGAVRLLLFWATCIVAAMLLLSAGGLAVAGKTSWILISSFALIFAVLSGYNSVLSGIQNAARQRATVALHQGVESWLRFLVVIGLLLWLGGSSAAAMLGYALSVALVLGSQYVFFRKIASKHEVVAEKQASWRAQIWRFAWPFATWGIFYWAQSASDRWSLGLFATTQEVGLYAVLFQLGYAPMALAAGMALQFFAPIFYQRAGDASDSQRNANVRRVSRRLTAVTLGLTAVACLIAQLFHSQIFGMLVAREYAPVSYLLPGVMLASGLFACGQTIGLDLLSQMKPHLMMTLTIVSSLVGVALNFIGAYLFGIPGVVCAGIIFSTVYAAWMAMLSRRSSATN